MRQFVLATAAVLCLAASARGQVRFLDEAFEHDREHPAAGLWAGNIELGGGWRYGIFRIAHDESSWTVESTVAVLLALSSDALDVEVKDERVAFTVAGQVAKIRLAGTLSGDGQRISGTVTDLSPDDPDPDSRFELARTVEALDLPRPMAFTGDAEIPGVMSLGMSFAFAETPGGNWVGHVDIPAQMTHGFVLAELEREGRVFTAMLPGPTPAQLALELAEDERRLTGTLTQGGYAIEIDFPRHDGYVGSKLNRPQNPMPPYPYTVEEVTIEHPDGHALAGTLTIPRIETHGDGPFPAAVLVTGSGPQDRDESLLGHKPFLVISDYLTRHGIAVLRYDDRGFAGSTGVFAGATSADFATDALAAVRFARTRATVDADHVGIIGHSEGGLIAPMVAGLDDDVAFLVLMAGPGVRGADLLIVQGEKIARAAGADDAAVAENRRQQEQIFAVLLGDDPHDAQEQTLREMLAAAPAVRGITDEADRAAAIDAQIAQLAGPWMRYLLSYDPEPTLAAVRCPVLALNGTLDLQVWHEQNLDEIDRIIREAGGDVTIVRYEGLNHLFQPATTGSIGEYADIEITFDERVSSDMVNWILRKTGVSKKGTTRPGDDGK